MSEGQKSPGFFRRNRKWIILAAAIWFSLPFVLMAGLWLLAEMGGHMGAR